MDHSNILTSIVGWNNRFPLDRWWRNKYGIPFMSPAHRESSFLAQLFEFEEDKVFAKLRSEISGGKEEEKDKYIPGSGDIFKASSDLKDFAKEAQREIEEMLKLENNG